MVIYIGLFATALLASLTVMPMIARLAIGAGVVDTPDERKVHHSTIPRLGGVGVALSLAFTLGVAVVVGVHWPATPRLDAQSLLPIFYGASLVFAVGLWDDISPVPALKKLAVQIVAAAIVAGAGILITRVTVLGTTYDLGPAALPLTIFWIVLITNAFNLMDGLDGLAGGLVVIAASTCAIVLIARGEQSAAMLLAALVGATSRSSSPTTFTRRRSFLATVEACWRGTLPRRNGDRRPSDRSDGASGDPASHHFRVAARRDDDLRLQKTPGRTRRRRLVALTVARPRARLHRRSQAHPSQAHGIRAFTSRNSPPALRPVTRVLDDCAPLHGAAVTPSRTQVTASRVTCWALLLLCMILVGWIRLLPQSLGTVDDRAERIARRQLQEPSTVEEPGSVAATARRLRSDLTYAGEDGREYVYLGDFDSYLWLRYARNYLRTGTPCDAVIDGECRDTFTKRSCRRTNDLRALVAPRRHGRPAPRHHLIQADAPLASERVPPPRHRGCSRRRPGVFHCAASGRHHRRRVCRRAHGGPSNRSHPDHRKRQRRVECGPPAVHGLGGDGGVGLDHFPSGIAVGGARRRRPFCRHGPGGAGSSSTWS